MEIDVLYELFKSMGENCYNIIPELSEIRGLDCNIYFPYNEQLGSESILNNKFETDLSNWTLEVGAGGGSIFWDNEAVKFQQLIQQDMYAYQSFMTTIGQRYRYVSRIADTDHTNNRLEIGTTAKGFDLYQSDEIGAGVLAGTFVATTTTTWFNMRDSGPDGGYSRWDYVSVKPSTDQLNIYNKKDNLYSYNEIPNVSGRFLLLGGDFYTRRFLSDKTIDTYTFPNLYILTDNEIEFPENSKVLAKTYDNYVYPFKIIDVRTIYGYDEEMVRLYECIAMEVKL